MTCQKTAWFSAVEPEPLTCVVPIWTQPGAGASDAVPIQLTFAIATSPAVPAFAQEMYWALAAPLAEGYVLLEEERKAAGSIVYGVGSARSSSRRESVQWPMEPLSCQAAPAGVTSRPCASRIFTG